MENTKEQHVLLRKGRQRFFLQQVMKKLHAPSLRSLNQFGFSIPYGTLKCYYTEKRLLPRNFFESLCYLAKLNPQIYAPTYLSENWGQIKGGKVSKRKSLKINGK